MMEVVASVGLVGGLLVYEVNGSGKGFPIALGLCPQANNIVAQYGWKFQCGFSISICLE